MLYEDQRRERTELQIQTYRVPRKGRFLRQIKNDIITYIRYNIHIRVRQAELYVSVRQAITLRR